MNAAEPSIEIACPHCRKPFTVPGSGKFICPHCSNPVDVGESPRIGKTKVNNGLGWWTIIAAIGWLGFIIPGGFICAASIIFLASTSAEDGGDSGMTLIFGIGGIFLLMIGLGFRSWALSGKFGIVCGSCGNKTTKHSIVCSVCKADFSS